MKTMAALILSSMSLIAAATASYAGEVYCPGVCDSYNGKVNYQCIASTLEAYNSDIYYNLSVEDINELLYTCKHAGHSKAVQVARDCANR